MTPSPATKISKRESERVSPAAHVRSTHYDLTSDKKAKKNQEEDTGSSKVSAGAFPVVDLIGEQSGKKAAAPEQEIEIVFDIRLASAHLHKRPVDGAQDDQIHNRDGKQEKCRHQRTDDSTDVPDAIQTMLQRQSRSGEHGGSDYNDG